ncbi:MAG: septum formation protein Maf [Candidatus Marinimicrobia bacterium]|nr:septum formation protein Maf [Candidatus Neomarinimicrobiota bacterium]|tara:strand:+ start:6149 stop:6742 length:594 start_codon:yes stop_codon:yes gene_type:complete
MKLILASKSPRRRYLLEIIGLNFSVVPSDYNESKISYRKNPKDFCMELAFNKANKIAGNYKNKIIIGADTIVVLNDELFPKPKDKNEAKSFLLKLSNKTHQVYTGISIIKNNKSIVFNESTHVTFKKLSNFEINHYVNNYDTLDKAGAYGIQDWSSIFVEKINGCYFNVVGFPLTKFYSKLKEFSPKIVENLLVKKI